MAVEPMSSYIQREYNMAKPVVSSPTQTPDVSDVDVSTINVPVSTQVLNPDSFYHTQKASPESSADIQAKSVIAEALNRYADTPEAYKSSSMLGGIIDDLTGRPYDYAYRNRELTAQTDIANKSYELDVAAFKLQQSLALIAQENADNDRKLREKQISLDEYALKQKELFEANRLAFDKQKYLSEERIALAKIKGDYNIATLKDDGGSVMFYVPDKNTYDSLFTPEGYHDETEENFKYEQGSKYKQGENMPYMARQPTGYRKSYGNRRFSKRGKVWSWKYKRYFNSYYSLKKFARMVRQLGYVPQRRNRFNRGYRNFRPRY